MSPSRLTRTLLPIVKAGKSGRCTISYAVVLEIPSSRPISSTLMVIVPEDEGMALGSSFNAVQVFPFLPYLLQATVFFGFLPSVWFHCFTPPGKYFSPGV